MTEIILDTIIDCLKIVPFLFIAFLVMEYLEHNISKKSINITKSSGKYGPIIGSILGVIPQCGFSVAASNLYATKIITKGTLIAIFLSTSDEMIPVLLSENIAIKKILLILGIKIVVGIIIGLLVDIIFKEENSSENTIDKLCEETHCDCEHKPILSSIKHTISITGFIFVFSLILNIIVEYYGHTYIEKVLSYNNVIGPLISSLVGLIPNCASSVIISEMYAKGIVNISSLIAGLLTNSGLGILILFKTNKNIKDNLLILSIIYVVGVLVGVLSSFLLA